ncbi:MAG: hypothetical protein MUC35_05745 [Candidatus Margulisbacteria bacterium]|jgi:hypothetical protein|nr:hypothetical protein [Candidatus Margulisiibacteriota bacterium]
MDSKFQIALKKANAEVKELGVDDPELKKIAFSKAIDFYLNVNRGLKEPKELHRIDLITRKPLEQKDSSFWEKVSDASGCAIDKLKDVYALKDKQISLVLSNIPGESKADKQRNLAALILYAYSEGMHEWTSSTLLAEAAKHSKLYDTNRFAKNIRHDWFRSHGVRKGIKYKLSGPGMNAVKALLIGLTKNNE